LTGPIKANPRHSGPQNLSNQGKIAVLKNKANTGAFALTGHNAAGTSQNTGLSSKWGWQRVGKEEIRAYFCDNGAGKLRDF